MKPDPTRSTVQKSQTPKPLKPYTRPAILHELTLETRAGSVLGVDPVMDLLGIGIE